MLRHVRSLAAGIVAFTFLAPFAVAEPKPEELAGQAAAAWLLLTDGGNYGESYDQASQYFKNAMTRDAWVSTLRAVRAPLGSLVSRKLKSATYTKTLPGAPDGQYVVIVYDTSFGKKQTAVETVTPMLDADAAWHVAGYYIK